MPRILTTLALVMVTLTLAVAAADAVAPAPEVTAPTPARTGPITVDREKACRAYVSAQAGFAQHPLLAVPTRIERHSDPAASAAITNTVPVSPTEVEV
ncbi:MAG: hypothetical protein H7287_07990, partial [Thermoleophilia bacterium]|nr:hypothetical protein [Thermoleophilia bacterium]